MKKIEQMLIKLLKRREEILDAIENHKLWVNTMNVNHEIGKIDLTELNLKTQYDIVEQILKEYKFLYSDEIDVINGYCMEFKVR